jgi:hypothetical protein
VFGISGKHRPGPILRGPVSSPDATNVIAHLTNFQTHIVVGFRGPLQKSHDLEDDFPLRWH